jgi:hypothetical protein
MLLQAVLGAATLALIAWNPFSADSEQTSGRTPPRKQSVYREFWDEIGCSHTNITLRAENAIGLVANTEYQPGSSMTILDSATTLSHQSDMIQRVLKLFPNDTDASFILALAFERVYPSSQFTPLWRISGLEIPDLRTVRLKGLFADDIDPKVLNMVVRDTSMNEWKSEADALINRCAYIASQLRLNIPPTHLRWALVMIKGFAVRDNSGRILAFSAALVLARHSPRVETGVIFNLTANGGLEILSTRRFKSCEEIVIPGALYFSDAWAFAYRGLFITEGHRAEFKFPGCTPIWLRREPEIDDNTLQGCGARSSGRSRHAALIKLVKALEDKRRNFQVSNSELRERLAPESADFAMLRIRDIESSIIANNLFSAKNMLEISRQNFPAYPS